MPISSIFACYTNLSVKAVETSFTINSPEIAYVGDELKMSISKNIAEQENIDSIEINMELSDELYFKKSNLLSPNFKVKCDKSKKKATFTLLKNQKLLLSPDSNDLIVLKINVKKTPFKNKNIASGNASVAFDISINDQNEKSTISKTILINAKHEISNILIDGKNFDFTKDKKDYEFKVPLDKESVNISIIRTDANNNESNEVISKKLNKNTPKKINIGDYQFTFIKEKEKEEPQKKKNK